MGDVRIYIADRRGEIAINEGRVRSTLNYAAYFSPHRLPIGILRHINEWEVLTEQSVQLAADAQTETLLIPLTDGFIVEVDGHKQSVPVGNVFVWKAMVDTALRIFPLSNSEGTFTFQQMVFSASAIDQAAGKQYRLPIVSREEKNKMTAVLDDASLSFQCYAGAFLGGNEFVLQGDANHRHFFAIALNGTFEIEERLLFQGDALSLEGYPRVALECLSSAGILLLLTF